MMSKTLVRYLRWKYPCIGLLFIVSLVSGCKDDELVPGISGQYTGYFPLEKGAWVEYDADSIVHLDIDDAFYLDTAIRSYHFQLREEVDSGFIDSEGEMAWRISRYKRSDTTAAWVFLNLWTAKRTNQSAQRVEDNLRYIKLSFPLDPRTSWNGNAYNNFPVEEYTYEDIHQAFSIGNMTFDSTVTVIQNEFISGINRIQKREIYANHIGMIKKTSDSLNTANLPNGSVVILNGAEYKLQLRDFKR